MYWISKLYIFNVLERVEIQSEDITRLTANCNAIFPIVLYWRGSLVVRTVESYSTCRGFKPHLRSIPLTSKPDILAYTVLRRTKLIQLKMP